MEFKGNLEKQATYLPVLLIHTNSDLEQIRLLAPVAENCFVLEWRESALELVLSFQDHPTPMQVLVVELE